ncbi:DnaJ C-terminal domain-containing protein [Rhodopseudomonas palustris]|uniref:J domain-containing protein n=1 Tax=Rhodopseudomonas palustris TaxID=1076 RepID=A0A418VQU0_RHOPL|nr:DnaJ C-terminal domain-containing protein [Rhodopseudomonas palustris]RJF78705.1 J domain-containing protein [Rhodopseudomonas palustris]
MATDPYATLGVERDATQADIQKAYRRLAKKLHPDLNPGNKAAEDKFKELSAANTLLSDPEQRARFDRGEIDASGTEQQPRRYYRDFAERDGWSGYTNGAGFADFSDLSGSEDLLSEIFGRAGRSTRRGRGADIRYHLELSFLDAVNGGKQSIVLPDGTTLEVNIPPGTRDGQTLRLKEKGRRGAGDGPAGDALIEISVLPHPYFVRKGDDILLELPISLKEGVLGAKLKVPTVSGAVTVSVPKWSSSGRKLRIKGRGVPRADGGRGDQYVTLKLVLPKKPDPDLERFMSDWQPSDSPRQSMRV